MIILKFTAITALLAMTVAVCILSGKTSILENNA